MGKSTSIKLKEYFKMKPEIPQPDFEPAEHGDFVATDKKLHLDVLDLVEEYRIELDPDRKDQHLIVSEEVVQALVDSAKLSKDDVVLEIGPGPGQITERIAEKAGRVFAIELDERFLPLLKRVQSRHPNVTINIGSAMEKKWPAVNKVVANPPFSIIEPIIGRIILEKNISTASLVVGDRGYRMSSSLSGGFSRLGLIIKAFFDVENVTGIDPEDFYPRSRERATAICLTRKRRSKEDVGLKSLVRRMLTSPNTNVGSLISNIIAEQYNPRRVDYRLIPSIESLRVLRTTLQKRLQDITNSEMMMLATTIERLNPRNSRRRQDRIDDDVDPDADFI